MSPELKEKFKKAARLREEKRFDLARETLLELHREEPRTPSILAVLARVCWDMGNLDEAISFFRKATVLRPSSEAVSLGLFHCLWQTQQEDEAFDEMRRFLTNNESEEYTRLLSEIRHEK